MKECGTACEKICGKSKPIFCKKQCVPACQCPRGLWRDGDKCYKKSFCPKKAPIPTPTPTCKGDLVMKECGTACEKICGKSKPIFCKKQCVPACQCPRGLWRDGDKCYKKSFC